MRTDSLTYGEAERMLASCFYVKEEDIKTRFRARLKHFQKLGIPTEGCKTRGVSFFYGFDQLHEWHFVFQLSGCFGIDPVKAVQILNTRKRYILFAYQSALEASGNNYYVQLELDVFQQVFSINAGEKLDDKKKALDGLLVFNLRRFSYILDGISTNKIALVAPPLVCCGDAA